MRNKQRRINKDITFIYLDAADKAAYAPISTEAKKRGYSISFTTNKFEKCEIGFYCQHVNFPEYSKLSVIMLHDIIQQYSNWPDIWLREPWDKYDVGILPSDQWVDNWNQCSQWYYTKPKIGVFKVGWPKADTVAYKSIDDIKKDFFNGHRLDPNKKTILYAPAWENDGKQDDFVKAMKKLNVNILIKQAPWDANLYPDQIKNIEEMFLLHKDDRQVTILPPETNIFDAIVVSDVLVSEESSTMCEAALMGIPSVSVSDWLIPDVSPSRFPKCDYEFAIHTKKENLDKCVQDILDNYQSIQTRIIDYSQHNFSNIGKTSAIIMDIIDDIIEDKPIRYLPINPRPSQIPSLSKLFWHVRHRAFIQIELNWSKNNIIIGNIWRLIRPILIKG